MAEGGSPDKRRVRRTVLVIGALVLFILGTAGWIAFRVVRFFRGPSALQTMAVSEETSAVDERFATDAGVDYVAAFNAEFGEGVTVENNAVVLMFEALGPDLLDEGFSISQEVLLVEVPRALGMPGGIPSGPGWALIDDYVAPGDPGPDGLPAEEGDGKLYGLLHECSTRPWRGRDNPLLASWLKANREALDLVVLASLREKWFWPAVPSDSPEAQIESYWPNAALNWESARGLAARAMCSLGEGEGEAACADMLALHRLARLICQDGSALTHRVGLGVEEKACEAGLAIARYAPVDAPVRAEMLRQLLALSELPGPLRAHDKTGRWELVAYVPEYAKRFGLPQTTRDLDAIRSVVNGWWDRVVEAAREETWADRAAAFDAISADADAMLAEMRSLRTLAKLAAPPSEEKRDTVLRTTGVLLWIESATFPEFHFAEHLSRVQQLDVVTIALALAGYRAEHGAYPGSLAALTPDWLPEVPRDRFTGVQLVYRLTDDGYVLYSLGPDMVDGGGPSEDRDVSDDVGIIMPAPGEPEP